MNTLKDKLRKIYVPFLVIAVCFIPAYTLLHWLLFIKAGIPLKEDVIKFWLPFGLPFIPVLIWVRPKLNLLKFKNDNGSFVFQIIAAFAIAIPTIVAQDYLVTAIGKLTQLDSISQLDKAEKTKYYSLKRHYVDKKHLAVQNTATVTGKYNEDFNMIIYVAMPILNDAFDSALYKPTKWLGQKYTERINNRLSDSEKDEKYKAFAERCQREFEETDFDRFTYLEVLGNTEDHDEYNNAINKVIPGNSKVSMIFEAKTEPFEARNGENFFWIFGSFGIGAMIFFLLLLFPKFKESEETKSESGDTSEDTGLREVFEFFIPKEGYFITPIIINLNILVYIAMVIAGLGFVSFKGVDLLNWGANYKPLTTNGQWWRLVTSTFLHGGLMHILANMYGLLFVGIFLEPLLGKTKFAILYLATGILASMASVWWYDATVSVGASGAIFGLYGFFLACILLKVFPADFSKVFLTSTLIFVGFNLLMGFAGGIDNAAHIGGLVSGLIIGLLMSGQLKKQVEATMVEDIQNPE